MLWVPPHGIFIPVLEKNATVWGEIRGFWIGNPFNLFLILTGPFFLQGRI